jgi:hypothetical protein
MAGIPGSAVDTGGWLRSGFLVAALRYRWAVTIALDLTARVMTPLLVGLVGLGGRRAGGGSRAFGGRRPRVVAPGRLDRPSACACCAPRARSPPPRPTPASEADVERLGIAITETVYVHVRVTHDRGSGRRLVPPTSGGYPGIVESGVLLARFGGRRSWRGPVLQPCLGPVLVHVACGDVWALTWCLRTCCGASWVLASSRLRMTTSPSSND